MKKISRFILGLLYVAFLVNVVIFIYHINIFKYVSPYINYAIIFLIVLTIILVILGIKFIVIDMINNKYSLKAITSLFITIILLNIILLFGNFGGDYLYKIVKKITGLEEIYKTVIIVKNDSDIYSLEDLNNKKIGLLSNKNDYEDYILPYEILENNDLIDKVEIVYFSDNLASLNSLFNGEVDAIGITSNFVSVYEEYFDNLTDVRIIASNDKMVSKKQNSLNVNKPFTVLIIGSDQINSGIYNSDVLILMTVNMQTKNIVMVDVVRDTYAYNKAIDKMDKITHSGWYGEQNIVDNVSNLFGIDIDYYVKFNFTGVVNLVDMIGGLYLDVPYTCPIDNDKRESLGYSIYPGYQKLNGYETLALARTRLAYGSSLFSRGKMQMYIIEETIKQTSKDVIFNNIIEFLNNVGDNVKTNIKDETLYKYIRKYTDIKNELKFSKYQLEGVDSSYYHEGMGETIYTYKYKEESLNELSNLLKQNLES